MDPTGGFRDRTGHAAWLAKLAIAFISVSLEDPGVVGQVSLGMLASAIAQARTGTVVSSPCNRSALRT